MGITIKTGLTKRSEGQDSSQAYQFAAMWEKDLRYLWKNWTNRQDWLSLLQEGKCMCVCLGGQITLLDHFTGR